MSVIQNNLLMTPEGYQISRSVRLRRSASAYFNRTFGTPTNANIWTLSGWAKRGLLGTQISLFGSNVSTAYTSISFLSGDTLRINLANGTNAQLVTTQVFRDPSAFYHIAIAYDSTQATASNRIKLYVNGAQVTAFSTANYPSLNVSAEWNYSGAAGTIGTAATEYWDGYLTEVNFIDGQALTPSSFGETDAVTGVWKPKKYAGTYGTNGFYLNFSDPSAATAAAIGKDNSGNGNNWTPNNISVTAGVTYDSMLDVPTMWADGGNGRGNYCTLNPLNQTGSQTIAQGNLQVFATSSGGANCAVYSTQAITSGKYYFEAYTDQDSVSGNCMIGVANANAPLNSTWYGAVDGWSIDNNSNGNLYKRHNGALTSLATRSSQIQTLMIAVDKDSGKIWFGTNGTWLGSGDPSAGTNAAYSDVTIDAVTPATYVYGNSGGADNIQINFGQRPFAYTPPTGFKALNTQNLPDATIKKGNQYFDATTYTGNGSTLSVTNSGSMQPDLVWYKSRGAARDHGLFDSVRGATAYLGSNLTNAEQTVSGVTAFNSNGFTLGSAVGGNNSGEAFVGWQWKESVSAGFDIVTYTGTGVARTVAHSLGVAPKMMIVKNRATSTINWRVYHADLTAAKIIYLSSTAAAATDSTQWNNTSPTSSVFSVGTDQGVNGNGEGLVAYLFAEVAGFSKFGSYTGNGSADGPFVYTGFRPRFVMIKKTDTTGNWCIHDSSRSSINVMNEQLNPNLSNAESGAGGLIDFTANGFKLRGTATDLNSSVGTHIFMALAENPFKNSLAR